MRLSTQAHGKARCVYLLVLCAVQLLMGVLYLDTVPRIHVDEVWDASVGYELAESGVLRHPFIHNFGGMEIYFVQPRVTLPIICAGLFKVTGYSITISRLPSLLFGILAVIALYHVAERFFNSKQGFFVCLLTITNTWFWIISRRCRPEIYYTAFALVFLWLVTSYFDRDRKITAFLAGIVAALATLAHPNGLLIVAVISISWLIWKGKPRLFKFVIWSLAGFLLLFLPYVIYAFWASGQPDVSFINQVQLGYPSPFDSIAAKELARWGAFFRPPFGIPIALVMIAGWLSAWWKSTAEDKFTATVVAGFLLILPFFSVNALPYYIATVVPFFSMLVIRFIYRLHDFACFENSKKFYYVVRIAVILMFVAPSLSAIFLVLYTQRGTNFNSIVDEVAEVVGPSGKIHADPVFWVGHEKYIYGPYVITYNVVKGSEALRWAYAQEFEYVIRTTWDSKFPQQGARKAPKSMPGFRPYLIGDNLCKMFGNKVYEFYNEDYGPIEIYKINWPANPASYGLKKRAK